MANRLKVYSARVIKPYREVDSVQKKLVHITFSYQVKLIAQSRVFSSCCYVFYEILPIIDFTSFKSFLIWEAGP